MVLNSGKHRSLFIFFLSFSVVSFELILTRIFSVLMWYHFASLAIGVAMLGLGFGSVLAYKKNDFNEKLVEKVFVFYLCIFLFFHFSFFLLHYNAEILVPYLSFFHQPYFQPFQRGVFYTLNYKLIVGLILIYIFLILPFFLTGYLMTLFFKKYYFESQKLYYADLLGASFSALFIIFTLFFLNPMAILSIITFIGATILFIYSDKKIIYGSLMVLSIVFLVLSIFFKNDEIMVARGKLAKNIIWSKWNPFSRVIIYPLKGEEKVNPFGQSPLYRGYVPEQWGVLVDDTGYTVASEFPSNEDIKNFFRWNIISLPYVLKKGETLIIGPGGGKDINCAISMGVRKENITAVELNPQVVEAVNIILGEKTCKLYNLTKTFIAEGRSFLERDKNYYDVIQATSVYGRIPPASGIFTFAEDSLYTIEAFNTYFKRLNDGGILSLSRFIYEKTIPKLILLSKEALKNLNIEKPENALFLVKERGIATLLVKKGWFTKDEVDKLLTFCNERGFEVLYEPYGIYDNVFSEFIRGTRKINLDIPTDDKPFYYYNLSGKEFFSSIIYGNDSFEERGIYILRMVLILNIFLSIIIFVLPLFGEDVGNTKIGEKIFAGFIFASLGLGYILFEIVMIKCFSLFLETPIYSMIFVVGSLLFFSALGSLFSSRFIINHRIMITTFMVLILLLFLSGFVIKYVNMFLYIPFYVKMILVVLFIGINGFFMGIPFPYMLKMLGKKDEKLVAWGIGVNSAFSVIGSFLTLLIVINIGYQKAVFVSVFCYIFALASLIMLLRYQNV
jgi:hypothetical protein